MAGQDATGTIDLDSALTEDQDQLPHTHTQESERVLEGQGSSEQTQEAL